MHEITEKCITEAVNCIFGENYDKINNSNSNGDMDMDNISAGIAKNQQNYRILLDTGAFVCYTLSSK